MNTPHGDGPLLVVMGVSGSGKTTMGLALAHHLGVEYGDADDFHSAASVAKMRSGVPLTDADREPWLCAIAHWLQQRAGAGAVASCSALRRRYRDTLREAAPATAFVHCTADRDVIAQRMRERTDHFMPAALLDSQLETLEPLEPDEAGLTVDMDEPVDVLVGSVLSWWNNVQVSRTGGKHT